jgi:biopolymer transport protein ExbB/TolQ
VRSLAYHFEEGGWGMYPLTACLAVTLFLSIERAWALFRARPDADALLKALQAHLGMGDVSGAVAICEQNRGSLARIALAGLRESMHSEPRIGAAIRMQWWIETPPLERRLGHLQLMVQIATLFGLLGTTTGLSVGFCGNNADPVSRATMLARGISESMNCTAGGLFVSMIALLALCLFATRARIYYVTSSKRAHSRFTTC